MAVEYVNNFATTLGTALSSVAPGTSGSLVVAAGYGANFPAVAAPDVAFLTIIENSNIEIALVTAHTASSDTFTVTRGYEGIGNSAPTSPAFTTAAKVECRLTAKSLDMITQPYLELLTQTSDAAAAAGRIRFFARDVAGRVMPKWTAPSGVDYVVQPLMANNQVFMARPSSATTALQMFGIVLTEGGTATHPAIAIAAPKHYSSIKRKRYVNIVTTASQVLGAFSPTATFIRGDAASLGGLFFFARVAFPLFPAGTRVFVGLSSLLTGMVAADPSGQAAGFIGMGMDIADTNLTVMRRDGTTATTKTAMSAGAQARVTNTWFDVYVFAAPNDAGMQIRIDRFDQATGAQTTIHNERFTTNIPNNTSHLLAPHVLISNGTANTVVNTVGIEIASIYGESDF